MVSLTEERYGVYTSEARGSVHQCINPPEFNANDLSARHLILQHALGRCIFVRHALLSPYLARHALLSVTLFYACAKGWQGRDTRVHAFVVARWMRSPHAWALDGRRGYGETSPSTSARAIDSLVPRLSLSAHKLYARDL